MKYLVSHQGQESGPFTLDEVVSKVKAKEIELFDYIYDEAKQDWVLLMEHSGLAAKLKSNKPPRPPQAQEVPAAPSSNLTGTGTTEDSAKAHVIGDWYVLKGENKFGPFAYADVVKMLQQKVVFPFDFIWHTAMEQWRRVVEIQDFKEESIREYFARKESKKADIFMPRKFNRHKFSGRVLVHDNMAVWTGEGFEISKGGVGLTMKNGLVIPGQQVHVHFTAQDDFPSFNALCEVVSKKFVNDGTPIQYGLRFVSLSQEAQETFYKKVA